MTNLLETAIASTRAALRAAWRRGTGALPGSGVQCAKLGFGEFSPRASTSCRRGLGMDNGAEILVGPAACVRGLRTRMSALQYRQLVDAPGHPGVTDPACRGPSVDFHAVAA
jgi:hypothetical protein